MRFTITALGCTGGAPVGGAVAQVVRYLHGRRVLGPAHGVSRDQQPGRYYADSVEGTGRWLGLGTEELGVAGVVDDHEFAQVLAGRHPRTGERLITAQGSAGRTATLGVGTATRRAANGERLYTLADVAVCLNLERDEVDELVAVGELVAFNTLLNVLTATTGPPAVGDVAPAAGGLLVACIDADGTRLITETELARVEAARGVQTTAVTVLAGGDGEDELTVAHAATILGVSNRYLRGLCGRYLANATKIDAAEAAGETHPRAYVRARRHGRGYRIVRPDLAALAERRVPPAVRFGYDLTATTEKSLSLLGLLGDNDTRSAVLACRPGRQRHRPVLPRAARRRRPCGGGTGRVSERGSRAVFVGSDPPPALRSLTRRPCACRTRSAGSVNPVASTRQRAGRRNACHKSTVLSALWKPTWSTRWPSIGARRVPPRSRAEGVPMGRKLMWVEWDDDARLSQSRKKPGAYSPLTRDSDDRLGHVTLSDADEDDYEPSSSWPPGPDPHSEWDPEKFQQQVEAVATVLTLLAEGVVWAAPHVRQWWSDSAKPAIKSTGRKVKTTLTRAPGLRRTKDAIAVPVPPGPRSGSERAEVESIGPEMSSAEAQQRFARAVVAAAYAEEQMRLLRNARITGDDDPLELASKMQELTPERLQAAIHLLLQAEPTMLDHDKLAAFENTVAAGELAPIRRVHELPSPPRTHD